MHKKVKCFAMVGVTLINMLGSANVLAATQDNEMYINSLFNNQKPTVKLVQGKVLSLKEHAVKELKDVTIDSWYIDSLAKLMGIGGIQGYEDNSFKPDSVTTVAEFTKILLASYGYVQPLGNENWYDNYIDQARKLGVIDAKDMYNYESGIQRQDMAKMVCKILNLEPDMAEDFAIFSDTSNVGTSWINRAFKENLIRGYYNGKGNRTFKPKDTATRAEVVTIIMRSLEYRENPSAFKIEQEKVYSALEQSVDTELEKHTYINGGKSSADTASSTTSEGMVQKERPVVLLGDSLTEGIASYEKFEDYKVLNHGINGNSSEQIKDRVGDVIKANPSKLFIMAGTNDILGGRDVALILKNYKDIVDQVQSKIPDCKIYIQSTMPLGEVALKEYTKASIDRIVALNKQLEQFAASRGATYLDIGQLYKDENGLLGKQYSNDGIHLIPIYYEKWVEVLKMNIKAE